MTPDSSHILQFCYFGSESCICFLNSSSQGAWAYELNPTNSSQSPLRHISILLYSFDLYSRCHSPYIRLLISLWVTVEITPSVIFLLLMLDVIDLFSIELLRRTSYNYGYVSVFIFQIRLLSIWNATPATQELNF